MPAILLDANVLLVFVVGSVEPELLGRSKRVREYAPADFDVLQDYLARFRSVVLIPNVVTETSNLLGHLHDDRRDECRLKLREFASALSERYIPSRAAATHPAFVRLGMTDAAILTALDRDTGVLTADQALHIAALTSGRFSKHFAELRDG